MSPDFNRNTYGFWAIFLCVAATHNVLRPYFITLRRHMLKCGDRQSVAQSVAAKVLPTQWFASSRHSATLLLFKINIITYVHTYACVHGGSIGTGFEMLRPRGGGVS